MDPKTAGKSEPESDSEEADEDEKDSLVKTVEAVNEANEEVDKINKSTSAAPLIAEKCEEAPEVKEVYTGFSSSEPVDQSKATPADYCAGGQKGYGKTNFEASIPNLAGEDVTAGIVYQGKQSDLKNSTPGGYRVRGFKFGHPKTTLVDGKVPEDDRELNYNDRTFSNSFLGRGKENTFEIIDAPIKEIYTGDKIDQRYVSTDLKRVQYSFFPRKVVPSIKTKGEELVMKMTTGEEIVVSSKTGKIVSGAAKEVPWKDNVVSGTVKGNKQVKTYIDNEFSYEGEGLYIQSIQHPEVNEKDPGSVVPIRAKVDGVVQECKLKSEDIWEHNSGHYLPKSDKDHDASYWTCHKFKFEKDQDLYDLIKKTCKDFKFPKLVK